MWYGAALPVAKSVVAHDDGITLTVAQGKFFSWYRSFGGDVPPAIRRSFVTLREWIPVRHALRPRGYFSFGGKSTEAIAVIQPGLIHGWSQQAKRHLVLAKKQVDLAVRSGTFEEFVALLAVSQVPVSFHSIFEDLVARHLAAHAEDIEIRVAVLDGTPVAVFVAAYCVAAGESVYLAGGFTPAGAYVQAMTLLVYDWFERCQSRGIERANFGSIVDARPLPFDPSVGYSLFKTHFGIHRVHRPGSFWRLSFGKTKDAA